MKYHFAHTLLQVVTTTTSKTHKNKFGKGTFIHCWQECKLVLLPSKTFWQFFKKLNRAVQNDPAILFPGIYTLEK